jgi:hypothetical protein
VPAYLDVKMVSEEDKIQVGGIVDLQKRAEKRTQQFTPRGSSLREDIDQFLKDRRFEPANTNIDSNTVAGALVVATVYALESYLPGSAGANTEVLSVEEMDGGSTYKYTINTNAPLEGQARFRAILDSTTGFTSLYTDEIEIQDFEVIQKRPGRDTYQYEITVSTV